MLSYPIHNTCLTLVGYAFLYVLPAVLATQEVSQPRTTRFDAEENGGVVLDEQ
jgi:hypothetical protein